MILQYSPLIDNNSNANSIGGDTRSCHAFSTTASVSSSFLQLADNDDDENIATAVASSLQYHATPSNSYEI
jgi:hypothetical protein